MHLYKSIAYITWIRLQFLLKNIVIKLPVFPSRSVHCDSVEVIAPLSGMAILKLIPRSSPARWTGCHCNTKCYTILICYLHESSLKHKIADNIHKAMSEFLNMCQLVSTMFVHHECSQWLNVTKIECHKDWNIQIAQLKDISTTYTHMLNSSHLATCHNIITHRSFNKYSAQELMQLVFAPSPDALSQDSAKIHTALTKRAWCSHTKEII